MLPEKLIQELITDCRVDAVFDEVTGLIVFLTHPVRLVRMKPILCDIQATHFRFTRSRFASVTKAARLLPHLSEFGFGTLTLLIAIRFGNPFPGLRWKSIEQSDSARPKELAPIGSAPAIPSFLKLVERLPVDSR